MPAAPLTPDDADSIRQRGEQDYFRHRGEYSNPYPLGSSEFDAYERGWFKSLKFNGGKLVSIDKRLAPKLTNRQQSDYNAYAEMKGRSAPRK